MTALNATARATLRAAGISQAEWARINYYSDGRWGGDACGCPDDRCIGYHHDGPDDCGCLAALLAGAEAGDDPDDGTEPYCLTCREWAGMFLGLEGWHHYRGDPAPGGQRTLYEADHETDIGWIVPPGRGLSPAGLDTLRQVLADAIAYRELRGDWHCADCEVHPAGLCEDHAADLDRTDAYLALASHLGIEVDR